MIDYDEAVETVRSALPRWWDVGPDEMPTPKDPFAALAILLAEVERLRAERDELRRMLGWRAQPTEGQERE